MTDQPPGPGSPADEQRTTALPRPPGYGTPADRRRPREPQGRPEDQAEDPYQDAPYQDTTVLRRPSAPPTGPSNVPGAVRAPRTGTPQPWPHPPVQPPVQQPVQPPVQPWAPGGYRTPASPSPAPQPPRPRPPSRSAMPLVDPDYAAAPLETDDWDDDPPIGRDPRGVRGRPPRRGAPADRDGSEPAVPPAGRSRRPALPPYTEPAGVGRYDDEIDDDPEAAAPVPRRGLTRTPRKLTVTRVAALRSRQLTHRGLEKFHGAVISDGADRSGLGHLTYAVMANYAVDAALAVALANTLFFAAAKADSTGKVLLYLLLTVAPFAVIAPLIGPLLDHLQNGRRIALAASSFGRAILAVIMAIKFDSWVIYPCALGMLVLSKSFGVLKAALTPRVLPESMTLVKTNSRLTVFGMIAGGVSGALAAGIGALTNSAGALGFTAACAVVGGWLCLRIPAWVESTEGEVPIERREPGPKNRVLPRPVAAALWTNATIRVETGFLALFIAFVIKSRYQSSSVVAGPGNPAPPPTDHEGFMQLLLLGAVGAAAGLGGFVGNALGARLPLRAPQTVALACLGSVIAAVLLAFLMPGLVTAGVVAFVGSTASSLAKVCLDSTIQHQLPEVSRASAFGRSESVLQLSWVFGGVVGLLIGGVWALSGNTVYMVGFGIVGLLLLAGFAQCLAVRMGKSLLPSVSLRNLLRRKPRRDTAPLQRPAAPLQRPAAPPQRPAAPSAGPASDGTGADRPGGAAGQKSGSSRPPRKAGRAR